MPKVRIHYIRGPIWAKTNEQIRKQVIEGKSPVTGKPTMAEIVEMLTKPLTAEEKQMGEIRRDRGPATYTGTAQELQKLYLEKRYTDFMPIILPTEELVDDMLKGTSHAPDEVVGRMNPGSDAGDTWTYTVKDCAVNAVMAGAKPEYFPLILAIASGNQTSINISDNGFAAAAVVNGTIRDEIGSTTMSVRGLCSRERRGWKGLEPHLHQRRELWKDRDHLYGYRAMRRTLLPPSSPKMKRRLPFAARCQRSNSPAAKGYGSATPRAAPLLSTREATMSSPCSADGAFFPRRTGRSMPGSRSRTPRSSRVSTNSESVCSTFIILSPPIANFVRTPDSIRWKPNKYILQPDPATQADAPAAKPRVAAWA